MLQLQLKSDPAKSRSGQILGIGYLNPNTTSRREKREVLRLRLKEPIDDDGLIFCGIEFETVGAENAKAFRPTALVVRGTCKRLSEEERRGL